MLVRQVLTAKTLLLGSFMKVEDGKYAPSISLSKSVVHEAAITLNDIWRVCNDHGLNSPMQKRKSARQITRVYEAV